MEVAARLFLRCAGCTRALDNAMTVLTDWPDDEKLKCERCGEGRFKAVCEQETSIEVGTAGEFREVVTQMTLLPGERWH